MKRRQIKITLRKYNKIYVMRWLPLFCSFGVGAASPRFEWCGFLTLPCGWSLVWCCLPPPPSSGWRCRSLPLPLWAVPLRVVLRSHPLFRVALLRPLRWCCFLVPPFGWYCSPILLLHVVAALLSQCCLASSLVGWCCLLLLGVVLLFPFCQCEMK